MNIKGSEIVSKIDFLIGSKKNEELENYIKENPAHAQAYIEYQMCDINLKQLSIQRVTLTLAYLLGK